MDMIKLKLLMMLWLKRRHSIHNTQPTYYEVETDPAWNPNENLPSPEGEKKITISTDRHLRKRARDTQEPVSHRSCKIPRGSSEPSDALGINGVNVDQDVKKEITDEDTYVSSLLSVHFEGKGKVAKEKIGGKNIKKEINGEKKIKKEKDGGKIKIEQSIKHTGKESNLTSNCKQTLPSSVKVETRASTSSSTPMTVKQEGGVLPPYMGEKE